MKTTIQIIFFFTLVINLSAQNTTLYLSGESKQETFVIDSLKYKAKHTNKQTAEGEIKLISSQLIQLGYLNFQLLELNTDKKDSVIALFSLKTRIDYVHIYIGKNNADIKSQFQESKNDTLFLKYGKLKTYLNKKYEELESSGQSFTKLRLQNITYKKNLLFAELILEPEHKRTINSILYKSQSIEKESILPKGYQKFLNRRFLNKKFNKKAIKSISDDINMIPFLKQSKYPEALFKKDSTIIYTYLEKHNSNTFDGYIGLSNDENQKIKPNGYLNLQLQNILHAGENFSLYWKNNGEQQKSLDTQLEIPFVFSSPFLIKGELHIFTQDSTFQNTETKLGLGYFFKLNSKININYNTTESSDIQNSNLKSLQDYKSKSINSSYYFAKEKNNVSLFDAKSSVFLNFGFGNRKTSTINNIENNTKQIVMKSDIQYTFSINANNYITLRNVNYILKSDTYLTNELYRFGGINSIQGFLENSLQANYTSFINTKYIYLLNEKLSVNSVIDFGIYQDLTDLINKNKLKKLKSFGAELSLKTNSNIIKLSLVNGTNEAEKTNLYNTILTICYNVKF